MTLDELRLRIEAAFPGCSVVRHRSMRADPFVNVELSEPLSIGGVLTPHMSFVAIFDGLGLAAVPNAVEECRAPGFDVWAVSDEIQRRIRNVSAHHLITARRRLAEGTRS